jgi:hypothetical protein
MSFARNSPHNSVALLPQLSRSAGHFLPWLEAAADRLVQKLFRAPGEVDVVFRPHEPLAFVRINHEQNFDETLATLWSEGATYESVLPSGEILTVACCGSENKTFLGIRGGSSPLAGAGSEITKQTKDSIRADG